MLAQGDESEIQDPKSVPEQVCFLLSRIAGSTRRFFDCTKKFKNQIKVF